ncbi:2-oxoacid:acceptor oxidoreductase subunit alpha [Patescibacteria group bacterium]|nr:2-oxoacid:acceptor oxidoreductase subunit alpha [Patescibacteria group bacterium]
MAETVTWKIGGEAGFGIMSAGIMLARAFSRLGYHTFATNEYPSLIRGGHNLITVRIATKRFEAMHREVHILVALNAETVTLHRDELSEGAIVVYDPNDQEWQALDFPKPVHLVAIPFKTIVTQKKAEPVMRNTVALGATVALLGAPLDVLSTVISDQFSKKGGTVITGNVEIARAGYDLVKKDAAVLSVCHLDPAEKSEPLLMINGSEAVGVGAVRGGLKFAAIYPMTPINSLITFLADHAKSLGIVYKQPEDEIAGINMAIGASVAGARSMVATSGGGFALMVEGLSLAGMVEAPLVIDMGMRVGPATGMPTWTEQGELLFVVRAGHGEFARIVLAPGDAGEAYKETVRAFQLADTFQTPVFVLTDKYINESQWCVPKSVFTGDIVIDRGNVADPSTLPAEGAYPRYRADSPDGVSARTFPGTKHGQYFINSYEHDDVGHATEDPAKRIAMVEKRKRKLAAIEREAPLPVVYGDEKAEITFLTWGSTKGPVLEALEMADYTIGGKKANMVHFTWVYPLPAGKVAKLLGGKKRIIDVEQNATAQFASLLREATGIEIQEKLLKFDGRPFYPEEILEKVKVKTIFR